MNTHKPSVLELYSNTYLDYLNPQPDQITIEDIARGLTYTCRFGGQLDQWYSVAEHAIATADLMWEATYGDPEQTLAALHHDSHEAYLGDLPSPLKRAMKQLGFDIHDLAEPIDTAIATAFGFSASLFSTPLMKQTDHKQMWREVKTLRRSGGDNDYWTYWGFTDPGPPYIAHQNTKQTEAHFLAQHHTLIQQIQQQRSS